MTGSLTLEQALQEELSKIREEIQVQQYGDFKPDSLAWLALVPVWTESLADSVHFPTGGLTLEGFLDKAQKNRMCTRRTEYKLKGNGVRQFWIQKDNLNSLLDFLKKEMSARWLQDRAQRIATLLLKSQKSGIHLLPATQHWAELAATLKAGPEATNAYLDNKFLELVNSGQTGEAIEWVNIGLHLAAAVEGNLRNTILTGKKRIELVYREQHDQHYLKDYLEIKDQIDAFKNLIETRELPWALHFVGMGGVGKTMLMRHISHHFQGEFITARVDFDNLSPEYPRRRPGQLLRYFAEELRMYTGAIPQQIKLFESLKQKLDALNKNLEEQELIASQSGTRVDFWGVIGSREFESILTDFSGILKLFDHRVILILDTCEELVKLEPVGDRLPHLETTFTILERLHEKVPSLRVIFAGRRLLAKEGFEWKANFEQPSKLPDLKDYLAIHPIRGFTRDQAVFFLREKKRLARGKEYEDAILEASSEIGDPIDLTYGLPPDWDVARYNPFDLSLYADWIQEDKKVTLKQIQNRETDPYVEFRIYARLEPALKKLLPGVTQLGRFDAKMLRLVFENPDDHAYEQAFLRLGDQEWIDHASHPDGGTQSYLKVEPNLLIRLVRYYQSERNRDNYNQAGRLLAPEIARMALEHNLSEVTEDLVGPALRLLDPPAVADFWSRLEKRSIAEGKWDWMEGLLEKLPGGPGSVNESSHPARAFYLATKLSIQNHKTAGLSLDPEKWEEIYTAAENTHESFKDWLKTRAMIGMAAGYRPGADSQHILALMGIMLSFPDVDAVLPQVEVSDRETYRTQLAASMCSSLDQMLQHGFETAPGRLKDIDENLLLGVIGWGLDPANPKAVLSKSGVSLIDSTEWTLDRAAESDRLFPPQITIFALMLAARAAHIMGLPQRDLILERVHTLLNSWRAEPPLFQFYAWVPPASLVDYARLETLRLSPPLFILASESQISTSYSRTRNERDWMGDQEKRSWNKLFYSEALDGWIQEALPRMRATSAERLVSRIIQLRMADSLNIDTDLLIKIESLLVSRAESPRAGTAHLSAPPLAVTLALGWSALMNPERAVNLLRDSAKKLRGAGKESLTNEYKRTQLRIARQARSILSLNDEFAKRSDSADLEDNAAAWPLNALVGAEAARGPEKITTDTGIPGNPDLVIYSAVDFPAEQASKVSDRRLALWWHCQSTLELNRQEMVLAVFYNLAKNRYLFIPEEAPNREAFELGLCLAEYERMRGANFPDAASLPAEEVPRPVSPDPKGLSPEPYIQGLRKLPLLCEEADLRLVVRSSATWKPTGSLEEILQYGIFRFGKRAVAQMALEEAELLALRLPTPALNLLTFAHRLFMSAGDYLGGLKTAIIGVIAATHGGDQEGFKHWFEDRLQETYTAWWKRSQPSDLPEWGKLTRKMTLDAVSGQGWKASGLGGWWDRLIACILWHWQPDISVRERDRIQRWLKDSYLNSQPIELDREVQYREISLPKKAGLTTLDKILIVIGALIGLATLAGGYFLLGWLIGRFIWPNGIRWYWQGLIYFGILILFNTVPGWVNLRGLFLSKSRVRFDIRKEAGDPDGEAGFRLDLYQIKYLLLTPRSPIQLRTASFQVPYIGLESYQEEARKFPPEVQELLHSWSKMLPPHSLPIQINPDPQSQQVPWEAILNLNSRFLDEDQAANRNTKVIVDPRPQALQFYRIDPELPTRRVSLLQFYTIRNQVVVISNPAWQTLIEEGWGHIRTRFLEGVQGGRWMESGRMSRVLHLVGTPIGQPENVLLDLGESSGGKMFTEKSAYTEIMYQQSVLQQDTFAKGSFNLDSYQTTISPSDLYARLYPVIILQGEPAGSKLRLSSEREKMGLLHAFAFDLLRLGAWSVIVIPPLEPDLAIQVLSGIRKKVPVLGIPRLNRLLNMVKTAKKTIKNARDIPTAPVILDELAQDVTLYYNGPMKGVHQQRFEPNTTVAV